MPTKEESRAQYQPQTQQWQHKVIRKSQCGCKPQGFFYVGAMVLDLGFQIFLFRSGLGQEK